MKYDKKHFKGHELVFNEETFKYETKDERLDILKNSKEITCKCCSKTSYEADDCISFNSSVIYACCGHGVEDMAYIKLRNGESYEGKEALEYMKKNNIRK